MNKIISKEQFRKLLHDGMRIHVGGFMVVGTPVNLIDEIVASQVKDLTIICNDAGLPGQGVGKLLEQNQVKKLIASHIGLNPMAGQMMSSGELDVELVPQGTLAERIRAYGAGLGGVLTPTGIGTVVADGKEIITIDGTQYILEKPIGADLAILLGHVVDTMGNITYSKTTRNFNPVMATAANTVVVGARTIQDTYLEPDTIHTPHVFVDYIVGGEQ